MTRPQNLSQWLMPLVAVGLGGVILAAEAANGDLQEGLVWFAVLTAIGALLAFGGRFQAVRDARGGEDDEREALIGTRALAATGIVLVLVLTGFIVFRLARGDDPAPYTYIIAAGGITYVVALLALHRRY